MTDPYLWLEDRNGADAVAWAQAESEVSKNNFEKDPRFQQCSQEIFDLLTSKDKIPMVQLFDGYAYNLWQDDKHKRGLWRRTMIQDYKNADPKWEVLLDIDELAQKENQPWVYKSCTQMQGYDHCILSLAKDNQDACESREFSLSKKEFIKDGFFIPESKSNFDWFDENHLLIAPALSDDQKTNSGYPRKAFCWTRGEDLVSAKLLYEGKIDDVSIWVSTVQDHGRLIGKIGRYVNSDFNEVRIVSPDLKLILLEKPQDSWLQTIFNGKYFLSLRSEWKGFPEGSIVSVSSEKIQLVYKPHKASSFAGLMRTSKRIYLQIDENVRGQIFEATIDDKEQWRLESIFKSESMFSIYASEDTADVAIFEEEGYLQPSRFFMKEGGVISEIKKTKSRFNEAAYLTEQFWTRSKDGVLIPYTVIRAKSLVYDGTNPTLLYGYGGFAISRTPFYDAVLGNAWLEKGGVYVMANIRGGGEFGPQWHKAAMKENKQKSYDDFIAIAEDLINRRITSPRHLGIQGGSNGGLLVGAVVVQRPELFNAVICSVPLLDMIRYAKLPPGASWADEYGDPEDPKFRDAILKYSPYQNISKEKKYPKLFIKTTQADDRVHPGHARKMVARMREFGHDVIYFEATDGGHGGGGVDLQDQARITAYSYVYLYQQLMPEKSKRSPV